MRTEDAKLINCGNDFYPTFFENLCKALEEGCVVSAYVDCIGHTRNNRVQEVYREKLIEKYGEKLSYKNSGGEFSYSYYYELKQ